MGNFELPYFSSLYKLKHQDTVALLVWRCTVNPLKSFHLPKENLVILLHNKMKVNVIYENTHFKLIPKSKVFPCLRMLRSNGSKWNLIDTFIWLKGISRNIRARRGAVFPPPLTSLKGTCQPTIYRNWSVAVISLIL